MWALLYGLGSVACAVAVCQHMWKNRYYDGAEVVLFTVWAFLFWPVLVVFGAFQALIHLVDRARKVN